MPIANVLLDADIFTSFDVTSLSIEIPINDALEKLRKRLATDEKKGKLSGPSKSLH